MALHDLRMKLLRFDNVDKFLIEYKECWTAVDEAVKALPDHAPEGEDIVETRKAMWWAMRHIVPKLRDNPAKVARVFEVFEEFPVNLD
jgi:hypothetical protein